MLKQDRGIEGTYWGGGAYVGGCNTIALWENNMVAVPGGKAACDGGGAFLASVGKRIGNAPNAENEVWAGPLDCLQGDGGTGNCADSGSAKCEMKNWNLWTYDAGVPASITFTQGNPPSGAGYGNDNQIIRMAGSGLDAGQTTTSSIYSVREVGVNGSQDAGVVDGAAARAAQVLFRSTDCGRTWNYVDILDPCDKARDDAGGCSTITQGGLDYPQIVGSPVDPKTSYLNMIETGDHQDGIAVWKSSDFGNTWNAATLQDGGPTLDRLPHGWQQPVPVGDRLFLVGVEGAGDLTLRWYDGTNVYPGLAQATMGCPSCRIRAGEINSLVPFLAQGLLGSSIGQFGSDYLLRAIYPVTTTVGGNTVVRFRVLFLRVSGNGPAVEEGSFDIAPDYPNGSIVQAAIINSDRLDLAAGSASNVALLYWYESDATDHTAGGHNYGNMRVKGCVLRDLSTTCTHLALSVSNVGGVATERTFPGFEPEGDYLSGAFFYDANESSSQKLKFLASWTETPDLTLSGGQPVPNTSVWHANIVKVDP
jgi:hypothetical protein